MLEKLGLPPKPSLRGNNWVVDATHCQGCSSQFTFINRKHHCRRCGGIFCGSCTQQRMLLRGQGDSPVRICDPCKKLEEAARFEMRYGHKNKAAKGGSSKHASKKEDDILNQILGNDDKVLSTQKTSASCSNISEVASQVESGDVVRNLSLDQPASANMLTDSGSVTPEELRQQAVVEKQKYRTLKAEGKSEEALKAFKRGKELERQAGALEISLRKNRKKALSSNVDDIQQMEDESKAASHKNKPPSKETDDLSGELKKLGWSDFDLRDAEKKPATLSLEGELSSLLREVSQKPNKEKRTVSIDKSQVIAHKKKALELKRAGNTVEAKEELKRAKILERKIEEEELLGEDDDESDDELSSLIRSMDTDDEHDHVTKRYKSDNFDFDRIIGIGDDIGLDGNFEVTDEDMDDPEMSSALKSLGWQEDDMADSKESLVTEIQSLKREAVSQKRAGNTVEAMALLKKAKLLEMELENSDTHESDLMKSVEEPLSSTRASGNDAVAPKSKLMIQKELIALKKKALSLRREGKIDESDEELRKAKVLEEQLEDMSKARPAIAQPSIIGNKQKANDTILHEGNGDEEEAVTDQDMHDPAYLSLLKNLGWDDTEDNTQVPPISNGKYISDPSINQSVTSRKSKSEIQRELLTLKRKALNLRRQGDTDEAEEVLKMARSLEAQLHESSEEQTTQRSEDSLPENNNKGNTSTDVLLHDTKSSPHDSSRDEEDSERQAKKVMIRPEKHDNENEKPHEELRTTSLDHQPRDFSSLQQEIMAHKRKAVALKRDGKLAEAKEELRQAKLLEKRNLEENIPQTTTTTTSSTSDASRSASDDVSSSNDKEASPSSVSKPLSSRDRFKIQQESLGHKRQALKLRREGKTAEADAQFELAKALESQLQESDSAGSSSLPVDDASVEDFLDPQLLSALQSIGLGDGGQARSHQDIETPTDDANNTEREQLVERIKAEKVKAVNFKRSGKQAEALDALRRAKLYEKKLQSL